MLRHLKFLALALICYFAATASQAQPPDWAKIRVGVEGAYPPFSEIGADGKIKGFEIDLLNELCARMKAECTLVQLEFDGMIPALQARKIDVIFASMAITEKRQKVIAFSVPYINNPARFAAKAGAKFDFTQAGLKGKRIGVQRSTIHEGFVMKTFTQSEIVHYATQDQIFLDLKAGRVDLILGDGVAIDQGFLSRPDGKGFAFTGPEYNDPGIFGIGSGAGMRKTDAPTLAPKFSAAIKAVMADGTFNKINDRYFPYSIMPKH